MALFDTLEVRSAQIAEHARLRVERAAEIRRRRRNATRLALWYRQTHHQRAWRTRRLRARVLGLSSHNARSTFGASVALWPLVVEQARDARRDFTTPRPAFYEPACRVGVA